MKGQVGFWDFEHSLEALSAEGDPLEKLERTVCFEQFRPALSKAVRRSDPSKGGRPGFDVALKFKMLVLQGLYGLSLQQTAYQVQDRLTWLRFCGLRPGEAVPDANTLWDFREALITARALDRLFQTLDQMISDAGYLAMGGQIIDATLVAAPRQRNKDSEKEAIKAGQIPEAWKGSMEGQAGQITAEGSRGSLDDETLQSQAQRGWDAADRYRDPGLWLQKPHFH